MEAFSPTPHGAGRRDYGAAAGARSRSVCLGAGTARPYCTRPPVSPSTQRTMSRNARTSAEPKNVLAFCHESDARELTYVSTAYVSGVAWAVYESELDVGQELSNDYELSKLQAEQLVRSDTRLARTRSSVPASSSAIIIPAIRRPSTGFYSPLRIAYSLATTIHTKQFLEVDYLPLLWLEGRRTKELRSRGLGQRSDRHDSCAAPGGESNLRPGFAAPGHGESFVVGVFGGGAALYGRRYGRRRRRGATPPSRRRGRNGGL